MKETMVTFLGVQRPAGAWRTTPEGSRPGRGGLVRRSPPSRGDPTGAQAKVQEEAGCHSSVHSRFPRRPEAGPGEPREGAPALTLGGGAQAHPAAAALPVPGPRWGRRARPVPSRRGPGSAEPRGPGRCLLGGRRGAEWARRARSERRGRAARARGARAARAW